MADPTDQKHVVKKRLEPSTMRILWLYLAVAICWAGSGCRLTHNVLQTTVVEPLQYSRDAYEKLTHKRFIEMAQLALEQAISIERATLDNYQCDPYTVDYQSGFIDGFVDYLEAGGTGEPPTLPPRRYWKASYQSLDGHQSAEQWFEGYRHGAETARESTYRSLVAVPLSDAIVSDTLPYRYGRIQAVQETDIERGVYDEGDEDYDYEYDYDQNDASSSEDDVVDSENGKNGDASLDEDQRTLRGVNVGPILRVSERMSRLPQVRKR